MKVQTFTEILGADYYAGVPDSQLRALCDYLMHTYGIDPAHHVIGANEGNCTALAAGYYLATGKTPVVYMQNSGEGNIINPAAFAFQVTKYMEFRLSLWSDGEESREYTMNRSISIRER